MMVIVALARCNRTYVELKYVCYLFHRKGLQDVIVLM